MVVIAAVGRWISVLVGSGLKLGRPILAVAVVRSIRNGSPAKGSLTLLGGRVEVLVAGHHQAGRAGASGQKSLGSPGRMAACVV